MITLTKLGFQDRLKRYWLTFALGILLSLGAITNSLYLLITGHLFDFLLTLVFFLPGIYLLKRWRYSVNIPEKKWKMILSETLITGCVCFGMMILYLFLSLASIMLPLRGVIFYPGIMKRYEDPRLAHFPKLIPKNATEKEFYYRQGFLQGGTIIQLKYKLPPDEITELIIRYQERAKYVIYGSDPYPWHNYNEEYEIYITSYYTNGSNDAFGFPNSFKIFVINSFPFQAVDPVHSTTWNHGTTFGVAIDQENSIMVYWFEDW